MPDTTTETQTVAETTAVQEPAAQTTATAEVPTDVPEWAKDPAAAERMVREARQEAANARLQAREQARQEAAAEARQDVLKKLGLVTDDQPLTPEEAAKQIAAKDQQIRDLTVSSALSQALSEAKAAPAARDALLGSGVLSTLDPTSTTFQQDVNQAVTAYLTQNPYLKATQAAPVGGVDITGGAGAVRTYTRAQIADPAFYQANKTDIEAAVREPGTPRITT